MLAAFLFILAAHWVGDFPLQSCWMAENKWKDLEALALHCATYSACLLVASSLLWGWWGLLFVLFNGLAHFCVDTYSAPLTHRLWEEKKTHDFFTVIGLDQLVHQLCLGVSVWLMYQS